MYSLFWCLFSGLLVLGVLTACHSGRKIGGAGIPGGGPAATGQAIPGQRGADAAGNMSDADNQLPGDAANEHFLDTLLSRYPQYFARIVAHPDSFRVQVIYTRIDRNRDNKPSFRNYYFHADPDQYFYPASTVKLPVAALALQKLNELKLPGLDRNSTCITERAYSGQTAVYNDPSTPDGRPTVAQYVKKVFLVSDNDAFNRLYEFLGQEPINVQLHKMGYRDAAILHRLDISLSEQENRHTNPVNFFDTASISLYNQPMQNSTLKYPRRKDSLGNAWYHNDSLIHQPMDFSKKNRIALQDLHQILRSIIFPLSVSSGQNFNLRPEDYQFLLQYLSEYPRESEFPSYDTAVYPDAYGKLLYWGGQGGSLPKGKLRIFNKEGDAYGFLTDISYFADLEHGVEFMLSATIYCNSDGVMNDDLYDYDSVGLPFMQHLGQVIYEYELKRPRKQLPDLSMFRLTYQ